MFTKSFRILLISTLGLLVAGSALAGICQAVERPACCPQESCDILQSVSPTAPTISVPAPQTLAEAVPSPLSSISLLPVLEVSPANFYLITLQSHPSIAPPLI